MKNKPVMLTRRAVLEVAGSALSAELMLRYYLENRNHLSPWKPEWDDTKAKADYRTFLDPASLKKTVGELRYINRQ